MIDNIGIIYSPGYGAGWSTWGDAGQALDQELAIAIDNSEPYENVEAIAKRNWPNAYLGGLADCQVEWVEKGTQFIVEEYDGSESLTFQNSDYWQSA
jgi:hypothetical protein